VSATASIIRARARDIAEERVMALAMVWDEVVHHIVEAVLSHEDGKERELHVNIKADMVHELARLQMMLADKVVTRRVAGRDWGGIDPAAERRACLGPAGRAMIEGTGRVVYEHVWRKYMEERWLPKSRKALKREANPPPPATLAVKAVRNQHFISRWFIRDYWAMRDKATRWRRGINGWSKDDILFASWGHRPHSWDDRLEAWFGLLEGDAKQPIQRLLATAPLNPPQQKAFVGYLVIHLLRNPALIEGLREANRQLLEDAAAAAGKAFDEMAQAAHGSLFGNNELYDRLARPLLWSQWAIVSSDAPVFVLPDTFCARGQVDGELRLVVPLTPNMCFITLASKEREKRIVPFHHAADPGLADSLSRLLVQAAQSEFLSDSRFAGGLEGGTAADFNDVLALVEVAVGKGVSMMSPG